MKKFMLSVFLFFTFLTLLEAAPVLQSDADIVADNWSKHWSVLHNREINVSYSESIGTQMYLYHLDPAGFILISADDNLEPILAYDFTSTAPAEKPAGFLNWLDVYQEECDYVRVHEIEDARCNQLWSDLLSDDLSRYRNTRNVSPMIWSQWGEQDDWNQACPPDPIGPGGNAYAGSHAVAMAMLMKYWNHPAQGEGQNSYYLPDYGNIEAVFDTTHYGWTHMPNTFSTNWTEDLIFHCGVATSMNYGPTNSTTSIDAVAQAMIDHFRYSSEIDLLERSDYDETAWEGMLRTELENGRPLFYQGEGSALHAHLLDGYQNNDYFHFNWGNEGQFNGYFQLSAITPSTANYTLNQKALFNIQPSLGPVTIDESFENDWNTFNWEFAGQSEWQIATDEHFYGIKSAKSGDINHNQTSEIFQSWNVFADGPITFWRRVSCEDDGDNGYDRLEFWIDGAEVGRWGGERGWEQISYDIPAGVHEFRWVYRKDGSLVSGQDCAWIDAIDFPNGATPLNAPRNFTAEIVNDDSVLMTWEAPLIRNLLGYRIYRNNVEITTILNPNTLQFIDPDLPNGSYSYFARAVYDSGVSDPTVTYNINIEVLYPPTALVAAVSNFDDVLLAWNMPATQQSRRTPRELTRSLLGYRIYRNNTLIDSVSGQTTLQYAENDLPEGTYEYRVSAIYSSGYSELSNVAVAAIGVPWPPSGLTAQVQNFDEVFLDWTAPPQTMETLTGYKIYRNQSLVHELTDATNTSYTEVDLPNGTHEYQVTAIYGEIESGPSNTAMAAIEVPYPPRNLTADVVEDDVTLDWDAPSTGSRSLSAYYVYRNNSPIATIWNTNVTSYFDPMLANGFYAYKVVAVYGDVYSEPSNIVNIEMDIPYPPSNLTAQIENLNDIVLNWEQPPVQSGLRSFIGYHVVRNGVDHALVTDFNQLTWTDGNVDNGVYEYSVYAEYNAGNSEPTNDVEVTVEVLYPPRNLSYSIVDDDVVLTWDLPVTGGGLSRDLLGFSIFRDSDLIQTISDPAVLTWTDMNLANATYTYYMQANYTSGVSAPTDDLEVMVEVFYPATNLVGEIVDEDDVALSWSPALNSGGLRMLQGYRVYRNDAAITDVTPADTTWLDTTLPNGDHIYYVRAMYENGLSTETNHVPIHIELMYPARQLTTSVEGDDVGLTWLAPLTSGGLSRDLLGYRIYRDSEEIAIIDDPAQVTFMDMNLDNGSYGYTVRAEYAVGLSEPTNTALAFIEVLYPPTNLAAVVEEDAVSLSWNMPESGSTRNLLGYTIIRNGNVLLQIADPETIGYEDTGLANGEYAYEIIADYSTGQSAPDGTVTAYVEVLYAPRNLSCSIENYYNAVLTWNPPLNQGGLTRVMTGYEVFRDSVHIADVTEATYTDPAIPDGSYDYTVKAVYSSGVSHASNSVNAIIEYPYAPSGLSATVSQDTVSLTWTPPTSNTVLGYTVYRDEISIVEINDPAVLNFSDTGLPNGGYSYFVTARYNVDDSAPSNTVTATVEVLYPPQSLAASVDQDEVALTWQLPAVQGGLTRDLLGYKVYRDGADIAEINDPATLSYLDVDLANGAYDYEVSGIYTSGESQMSNLVTATVEVLYPPRSLAAAVDQDEVTLTWQLPAVQGGLTRDLLGYKVYRDGADIAEINDPATLSYLDVDLANGDYDYEVSALYSSGESQMSNLVTATVEVLYPPQNLAAAVDQDEVSLTWQLPAVQGGLTRDLLGYKVYRDGAEIAEINDPATLSYLDVDLANGAYDYEVSALYSSGESQMSNLVTATVEVLYTPRSLAASVDQDEVTLTWQLPAVQGGLTRDLLGYKVYRDGAEIAEINDPATLTYLDVDLANGAYDYEVSALYSSGESQMSNLVTATVEVLYPPQNLAAAVDQDEVTLTWQLPAVQGGLTRDLLGYKVYRDGAEIAEINDPATLTYLDVDLANGDYDYEVSALYSSGESQMSNLVTATVEVLYPPRNLSAVVDQDEVTLSWQLPSVQGGLTRDLLGYKVYRDGTEIAVINDPATFSYLDADLANGAYDYEVSALYSSGESQMSNLVTATVEVLYPPRSLAAAVDQDEVTLTWQLPAVQGGLTRDLLGYKVYRDGAEIAEINDPATLNYLDVDLANGAYDYEVSALYSSGESQMSNLVTATVEVLYPPQNLAADVDQDEVILTWQLPAVQGGLTRDLLGYKVYRDGAEIAEINDPATLSYLDVDLANGAYDYEVSAIYTSGESQMSNLVTATVEVLYPPRSLAASVDQDEVTLTWQLPEVQGGLTRDLLGYKVYRDGADIVEINDPATLTYLDVDLANGDYDYEVSALYSSGESQMSNLVTATVEVLYPPQNLSAAVDQDEVTLSWQQPATQGGLTRDLLGYKVYRDGAEIAEINAPATLSYLDVDLANGAYDYEVSAIYTSGESQMSNLVTATVEVLYPPRNLSAEVSNEVDAILNWDAPLTGGRSLNGYLVFRNGSLVATIGTPAQLTWTDYSLQNGGYDYSIKAFYTTGLSPASNTAHVDIDYNPVLDAPTNLNATVVNGNDVDLGWTAPASTQIGYKIYRDGEEIAELTDPATVSFTDTELPNGVYTYAVTAVYSEGESSPSNTAYADILITSPPQELAAQIQNDNDVALSWDPPVNAGYTGYVVYRNDSVIAVVEASIVNYTDIGLPNGEYDYYVKAQFNDNLSVASNTASVLVEILFPPTDLTADVVDGNDVILAWTAPATSRSLLGYNIYRNNDLIEEVTGVLTYTDSNLANGAYDYEVSAIYTSGESQMSNLVTAMIEVLYPPQNLTADVDQNDVTLSWQQPSMQRRLTRDFLGYKVYRNGTEIANISDPTTLTYLDVDLANGAYDYEVSAIYTSGESQRSNLVTAMIEVLYPPQNLAADIDQDEVTLSWQQPSMQRRLTRDFLGYKVYRDEVEIANISDPSALSYLDADLANGAYDYEVSAIYTSGESQRSNLVTAMIEVLYPPQNLAADIDQDEVTLSWQQPSVQGGLTRSLLGYKVYRDGAEIANISNPTTLSYLDADLANGAYDYEVSAVYTTGESQRSNLVTATVEVLYPPTGLTATVTVDDVLLNWSVPQTHRRNRSLTGYQLYCNESVIATIDNPAITTYTETDLVNGSYTYEVLAVYSSGNSPLSDPAVAVIAVVTPPENPVFTIVNGNDVLITWDLPINQTTPSFYTVYRDGAGVHTTDNGSVLTWTDTGLENGDFNFWLTATYDAGESIATDTTLVQIAVMNPPTGLAADVSLDMVHLTWVEPINASGLQGYTIHRDNVEIAHITDAEILVYDDNDLAGGNYQYFVTATFTVGESEPSNTVDATVLLPPPGNVSATPDSSDVVVSWDMPALRSLIGFRIYREGVEIAVLNDPGQLEYTDANLPNGDYSYTVQSLFTSDASAQSTPATCTVEALWAPENLAATLDNGNTVNLTWDAHPMGITMTAYKVYRDDVEIARIDDPAVTQYDDPELAPGNYTYTVTALYSSGESDPSNEALVEIHANGDEPIPPITTQLKGNAPNPFNPSTTLMFSIASDGPVNLTVYNVRGQKIATLVNNEILRAGEHSVVWNADTVGSGVYFVRMSAQKSQFIHKMLLLK